MTIWIPVWLLTVLKGVSLILGWELLKALWRGYNSLGDKMGWRDW